jgi:hypothetical protein
MNKFFFIPVSLLIASCSYASNYSWSISADTTKFDYAETDSTGLLDTERADFGKVNGLTLKIEPRYEGFYLSAAYAKGDTDYIGSLLTIPPSPYGSYRSTSTNEIADYSFGYKATARLDSHGDWEMPVTVGVGYRRWLRQGGYDELYDWGYYDVGVGLHTRLSPTMFIGADAAYRKAFNAQMYENLHGSTFDLKNVHGYKITVPFEIVHTPTLSSFVAYNYEYWNIGASDPIGLYYEPDSETKNETLSIGLKFKF